jgi:CelD/BcsL family acetyltransferase involved in cellulose biosynthesis
MREQQWLKIISSTADLRARAITSTEAFAALRERWNDLLMRSSTNSIFLTWEWLFSWWQQFGNDSELSIILIEKSDRLIGIAPLYYEKKRMRGVLPLVSLQWLGSGAVGSDYLDIIVEPDYQNEVYQAIYRYLIDNEHHWDLLRLCDMPQESRAFEHFCQQFQNQPEFNYQHDREYICPYIDLKGQSWQSFEMSLSSNMRYNLKRREKQVFDHLRAELARCDQSQNVSTLLDQIFDLHNRRWQLRGGSDGFAGRSIRAFHQRAAARLFEKGWLKLFLLEIDHKAVAGIYGLEYQNTFSFYQSGFDPAWDRYSVGMVLLGQTVKDAIARNLERYDFLHGAEEYKFKWTQTTRRTVSLLAYPRRRLSANLYLRLRALKKFLIK